MSKTFVCGGSVRDILLGRTPKDKDYVVVGSSHDKMIANGFKLIEATSFPVYLKNGEEYALARTELKNSSGGYHGFDIDFNPSITIEEDLRRRDITINSLAVPIDNWDEFTKTRNESLVIDPYNGIHDLRNGILRHTSEAFAEDPLRVLRVARFAARYKFDIAPETMKLMSKLVYMGEMETLTTERVWLEFEKAIMENAPSRFISSLWKCDAWFRLFPDINSGAGIHCLNKAVNENLSFDERVAALFAETYLVKVDKCLTRYKASSDLIRLIHNVWKVCQTIDTMGVLHFRETVFDMLKILDAYRRPSSFYQVCNVLRCLGYEKTVRIANELELAHKATAMVSFQTLSLEQQDLKGIEIGRAIDEHRQKILAELTFVS